MSYSSYFRRALLCYVLVSICINFANAQEYEFSTCWSELNAILDGNYSKGSINQDTVGQYIWHGPILGLKSDFPRNSITALTYEGCLKICGNHTETRSTRSALEITATWIFPLAIIFNLPYDSAHQKKFQKTFSAFLNWIGSPQTALAHTIFNVCQIRHCHRMAKTRNGLWNDAFYVLSCLGQFEIPTKDEEAELFHKTLVYGLFRPLSNHDGHIDRDQQYTADLLSKIAFQLRILRRRGVIPTLSSLAIFLIAFIFSIVLAFSDLQGNRTGSPLTLGLLYCWLPLLVIFSIIDRNPVSGERSAVLMSRWLFNVNAVMIAVKEPGDPENMAQPEWWTSQMSQNAMESFHIGEFVGQGRRVVYSGLADAVIRARGSYQLAQNIPTYESCARQVMDYLNGTRPGSWYTTAIVSLLMTWAEIMMAFLVAFFTPTFGLGCWSGSVLLYGILSSLTWGYHLLCKCPGPKGRILCHVFNFFSFSWIVFLTGLALTGAFKNCYCSTVQLSYPAFGGYIMFENFEFYIENFKMQVPWVVASVVGGLVPSVVFIIATLWWIKCQHLWSAEEIETIKSLEMANFEVHADTVWLAA